MRTGRDSPRWGPNGCVARACFNRDVLAIHLSDRRKNLRDPSSRKVIPKAWDIPRHGSGAQLEDRSGRVVRVIMVPIFEHSADIQGRIGWYQVRLGGSERPGL